MVSEAPASINTLLSSVTQGAFNKTWLFDNFIPSPILFSNFPIIFPSRSIRIKFLRRMINSLCHPNLITILSRINRFAANHQRYQPKALLSRFHLTSQSRYSEPPMGWGEISPTQWLRANKVMNRLSSTDNSNFQYLIIVKGVV